MAETNATLLQRIRSAGTPVRRATLGSVLTGFVGQAVLVVSGVIVARMLGPENRGYLALLILVPLIVAKVGGLGLPLAVTYQIARDRSASGAVWRAIGPVVVLQCGLLTGLHAVILWALLRGEPGYVIDASLLTLALVPAALAQEYGLAILQGAERFRAFNVLRTAPVVAYAAGVTVLLLADIDGLGDVAAVWTVANSALGVLTLTVAVARIGPPAPESAPSVGRMMAFGAKGLLGASSPIEYYRLDQAVVGLFLSATSLGLYTAALAFTNLPRFISTSVGMVAYPHVAAQHDRAEARRKLWRFFLITVAACAAVVVALEIASGWLVPFFFGEAFADAVPLVRILLVSGLLIAARRILADGARGLGLPTLGTVAEVASLLTLAPALAVLMGPRGAEGVALSLVISAAVGLLVMLAGLALSARPRARPRPSRLARVGTALAVLAIALAVDALAVLATVASPALGLGVLGVLLLCLAAALLRRRLRPRPLGDPGAIAAAEPASPQGPAAPADDGLGPARALYYLGVVFLGFLVVRPGAGLTVSDLLFLAALVMTTLTLIAMRRAAPVFMGPVLFLGVVLFAAGGLLSSFGADDAVESVTVVARVVYITLVWFWLGAVLLTKPSHLRVAIGCWVGSAALGGAGAIVQTLLGDVIPGGDVHYGRVSGFAYDVNDLGGLCAVAAIPASMLVAQAKRPAARLASIAGLLLIVAGLLLSSSVSAMVAVAGAGALWLAVATRRARVLVPLAAAVLLLSVFAAGNNRYWESPLERFETSSSRSGSADSTLYTRIDAFDAAWENIQASPLVGVGLTRLGAETSTGLAVHNLFLAAWYQAGLLGLLGILLIAAYVVSIGWRSAVEARDEEERATARALFAAVLAFLLFAQAQPTLFQRYGWVAVALVVALRGQQLRAVPLDRASRSERTEPAPGLVAPAT